MTLMQALAAGGGLTRAAPSAASGCTGAIRTDK